MFVIYTHQIEQMDSQYLSESVSQIDSHVRTHFPEEYQSMTDVDREAFIRSGIQSGQSFGLTTDRNLTIFIDFSVTFGSDFPTHQEWALVVLRDDSLLEDEKIDQLLERVDN